ncbi:MAG: nicotinamide-nucleotide amidohydrolase family protein [Clostridia bacterium]|nr:nicotinamide-nucleotide amidohydrolase family protein [Clostridia bacterium]
MNKIIKYFGDPDELIHWLEECIPAYKDYTIETKNLDSKVTLNNIEMREFNKLIYMLGDNVYAEDDASLEEILVEFLLENNLKISTAESCTGGMVASKIINVSGASEVFYEGMVTYSNEAKIERLNVNEEILDKYGAVSKEVAEEMAYGIVSENANVGIATTGIAGPGGGSENKPVGLVYISVIYQADPVVNRFIFEGTRNEIRESASNMALFCAYSYLREKLG